MGPPDNWYLFACYANFSTMCYGTSTRFFIKESCHDSWPGVSPCIKLEDEWKQYYLLCSENFEL